jgi:hypothetical protein
VLNEQEQIERELYDLPDASEFTIVDIRDFHSNLENLNLMKLYWNKILSLTAEVVKFRNERNNSFQEAQQNSANILKAVLAGIDIGEKQTK